MVRKVIASILIFMIAGAAVIVWWECSPSRNVYEVDELITGDPSEWPAAEPTPHGRWNYMSHVVNNAMAVKAPALWWRFSAAASDRTAPAAMIDQMLAHHGVATGMFTGDECLAGHQPTHGTELCAVVEYAFSLEVLLSVLGDPAFGDHLEHIIFNALPATFSPDMWSHQYDQQANQILCTVQDRIWNTNGPDANIYGLQPNFGCCTANLSQGWPKFASHLWMKTENSGLAATAYAPCSVKTDIDGIAVQIEVVTDYPFREDILVKIQAEKPVRFPLSLRIPAWASSATVQTPEKENIHPQAGSYCVIDRKWEGESEITLTFPMEPRATRRFNNALAIERGPLVYSLKIGEEWKRVNEDKPLRELPHADWEIFPTTPWNYALDVNEKTLAGDVVFNEHPMGKLPFSPQGAPISATVKGILLSAWTLVNGSAGPLPQSPVKVEGELETLTLVPYGCTNLRVTEFPTLK